MNIREEVFWYCGKEFKSYNEGRKYGPTNNINVTNFKHNMDGFTVDHLIPQSNNGSDDISNLVPSCHECNSCKGKHPLDYFRWLLVKRDMIKKYPDMGIEKFTGHNIKTLYELWGDLLGIEEYKFYYEQ